jgi:hypothetical protein
MRISIALLGYGAVGKEVHRKLKDIDGYGVDFQIHIIQVTDLAKHQVDKTENYWNVVGDGTIGTIKQTTIGDDAPWLRESDGHDTIIDCTSYNEESKQLVFDLLKRGLWLHTSSKELVLKHWQELLKICRSTPRAEITFNSIVASENMQKFMNINLNNQNIKKHIEEVKLHNSKNVTPETVADYIVRDIVTELESRRGRFKEKVVNTNIEGTDYTPTYFKSLFGGKNLIDVGREKTIVDSVPGDITNEYVANRHDHRVFGGLAGSELVAAGCSYTYGNGVPVEAAWASVVGERLGVLPYVVALPGLSTFYIVEELFRYFKAYGNPKILLCLFPDLNRFTTPLDGDILSNVGDTNKVEEVGTINILNKFDSRRVRYLKRPYKANQVFSQDLAIYYSIRSIRMLEQYCSSAGIKFLWSTWDGHFTSVCKNLSQDSYYAFDNYFNHRDYHNSFLYLTHDSTPGIPVPVENYDYCRLNHSDTKCGCGIYCNGSQIEEDLIEKYGIDQFVSGVDYTEENSAHPGVHYHYHMGEAFIAEIAKLAPRD